MLPAVKRDLPLLLLSLLILIGLFLIMHNALRDTVVVQQPVKEPSAIIPNAVLQQKTVQKVTKPTSAPPPAPPRPGQRIKNILRCVDQPLELKKLQYGDYWLVRNFVRGTVSTNVGCADTITYTTNGDYTFFGSLPMLVKRWLAPISFAIFAPGYDMIATLDSIQHVRSCLPESELIRKFVSFHIYFPTTHMPDYIPLDEAEMLQWDFDCLRQSVPYEIVIGSMMYRSVFNLTYPINVGRNIARKAANTHFILASDIELFPTPGLAQQFLALVERNWTAIVGDGSAKRVFPLPVFEVAKNVSIPATKAQLVRLLKTKQAIPFHEFICAKCHLVPRQDEWVKAPSADGQPLSLFSVTKREDEFKHWEPFYISDNREPIFDERVTWEGQSNKRVQGYAMCLLEYEYHVLHPAFLVHSPGFKCFDKKSPRQKFVAEMNNFIKTKIQQEYRILYGTNPKCKT